MAARWEKEEENKERLETMIFTLCIYSQEGEARRARAANATSPHAKPRRR